MPCQCGKASTQASTQSQATVTPAASGFLLAVPDAWHTLHTLFCTLRCTCTAGLRGAAIESREAAAAAAGRGRADMLATEGVSARRAGSGVAAAKARVLGVLVVRACSIPLRGFRVGGLFDLGEGSARAEGSRERASSREGIENAELCAPAASRGLSVETEAGGGGEGKGPRGLIRLRRVSESTKANSSASQKNVGRRRVAWESKTFSGRVLVTTHAVNASRVSVSLAAAEPAHRPAARPEQPPRRHVARGGGLAHCEASREAFGSGIFRRRGAGLQRWRDIGQKFCKPARCVLRDDAARKFIGRLPPQSAPARRNRSWELSRRARAQEMQSLDSSRHPPCAQLIGGFLRLTLVIGLWLVSSTVPDSISSLKRATPPSCCILDASVTLLCSALCSSQPGRLDRGLQRVKNFLAFDFNTAKPTML